MAGVRGREEWTECVEDGRTCGIDDEKLEKLSEQVCWKLQKLWKETTIKQTVPGKTGAVRSCPVPVALL